MPTRTATAQWNGDLPSGSGTITLPSVKFTTKYSFKTRFENDPGTNPEEILGAAHAGCFSMALAHILASSGHKATSIDTSAAVTVDKVGDGFKITKIHLTTAGVVPGCDDATFQEKVKLAEKGCPLSQALAAVPLEVTATLKT
jgi:osmotically inducible protein OsmC